MYAGGKKIFKIWGCKIITPAALALSDPQVPIKTLIILLGGGGFGEFKLPDFAEHR